MKKENRKTMILAMVPDNSPGRIGLQNSRFTLHITRLEEEVLPVLKSCLASIAELDEQILSEMEILPHCRLEVERIQIAKLRPTLR